MNTSIIYLNSIAFLDLFAVGLLIPLIPNHVIQLGANHIYVGLVGSLYAGFQLGSGPLIGNLSDIKGRRKVLIITLLLSGFAYILIGNTHSVLLILGMRAILGLFKQTQLLTKALVPDYEKCEEKQSEIYGKMAAISGVGITLGPIFGGHIVDKHPMYGFTILSFIVGLLFFINIGLAYLLPETHLKPDRQRNQPNYSITSTYENIKKTVIQLYQINWSIYWDIFLFKSLIAFAMSIYYSNYSLYLKSQYGLTQKYIGYVISIQGVIGSVCSFYMGFINSFYSRDRQFTLRNFHVFLLLTISFLGLILSFNIYVYILWLVPLAIANAVGRLVTMEMILRRSQGKHRGTLIGASNSVRSLTGVVAPMVAGFLGHYSSLSYVMYVAFFSSFIGAVISYRTKVKTE